MEIKFKTSLEGRRNLIKVLNKKNSLMIKKVEIIEGIKKKISNHEKMVSMKAIENEMLPKAIESINKNFNVVVQDLAETKNIVKALNDQLTVGEEEKKALELERDNLLKDKEICQINNLPNYKQNFPIRIKQ